MPGASLESLVIEERLSVMRGQDSGLPTDQSPHNQLLDSPL